MSRKICLYHPPAHNVLTPKFRRSEKGDALLDALIAMVLVLVLGMGSVYVSAKATVSQRQAASQQTASVQLRQRMQASGPALCSAAPTPISVAGSSLAVTATCTDRPDTQVSIGGTAVATMGTAVQKEVRLSVTSAALFGGSGTIAVDQRSVASGN